jgi:DNA-binding NtrC family response regulator
MDLNYVRGDTSGEEGLDLLSRIQQIDSTLPVVVMTAWSTVEIAVEAMRRGAKDFVPKPWKNERLLAILRTQIELSRALRKERQLEQENLLLRDETRQLLIAESRAMQPVLDAITRVGPSEANVLIMGENGSGKGVVAQALHTASTRKEKSMVTVNTSNIPEAVFESELFGHVAGAFTDAKSDRLGRFNLADGGILFLDEIATIPTNLQSKLLRVLENGQFEPVGSSKTYRVDVRILSATNAELGREVAEGRFREDLLYRLNTVEIRVPPLRDRKDDIPLLAKHFMRRHLARYRKQITGFDSASMQVLLDYPWPGNVRELDHTVERAVLMAKGEVVRASDLALGQKYEDSPRLEEMTLEEMERWLIKKTISRLNGDISQTAKALGLSRSALYRRLEKYKI